MTNGAPRPHMEGVPASPRVGVGRFILAIKEKSMRSVIFVAAAGGLMLLAAGPAETRPKFCHYFCQRPHGRLNMPCTDPDTLLPETELNWNKGHDPTPYEETHCDPAAGTVKEGG